MFEIKTTVPEVQFKLPVDDGAFIEFGIVPFDYLPREILTKYRAWVKKNSRIATEDDANLKMLELILDKEVYDRIAELPPAVAAQIAEHMAAESKATLGESGASTSS